jgi:hypothetical protein
MMLLPVMILTGPSFAPWGVLKQSTVGCGAAKKGVVQLCGVWLKVLSNGTEGGV